MIIFFGANGRLLLVTGFYIRSLWARNFEQLNFVPTLVITPLVFLGGSFYRIDMLPSAWQTISMFNPAMYLISGFRWAFLWDLRGIGRVIGPRRARVRHDFPGLYLVHLQDRVSTRN